MAYCLWLLLMVLYNTFCTSLPIYLYMLGIYGTDTKLCANVDLHLFDTACNLFPLEILHLSDGRILCHLYSY